MFPNHYLLFPANRKPYLILFSLEHIWLSLSLDIDSPSRRTNIKDLMFKASTGTEHITQLIGYLLKAGMILKTVPYCRQKKQYAGIPQLAIAIGTGGSCVMGDSIGDFMKSLVLPLSSP